MSAPDSNRSPLFSQRDRALHMAVWALRAATHWLRLALRHSDTVERDRLLGTMARVDAASRLLEGKP